MKRYIVVIVSILAVCAAIFRYSPAVNSNPQPVQNKAEMKWKQDYINKIAPIMMRDPLLEMLGQTDSAIPYTYEDAVKLTGHSCLVVAAAWSMTRKALGELYPKGEVPVRGQITVQAPGAEDEWNIGVIGEVMTYITGAAPMSGFSGSAFGEGKEQFGPPEAQRLLSIMGFPEAKTAKVMQIIGNHHSRSRYDYIELEFLKQADAIVNKTEESEMKTS